MAPRCLSIRYMAVSAAWLLTADVLHYEQLLHSLLLRGACLLRRRGMQQGQQQHHTCRQSGGAAAAMAGYVYFGHLRTPCSFTRLMWTLAELVAVGWQ
jgi:hypothetical protein